MCWFGHRSSISGSFRIILCLGTRSLSRSVSLESRPPHRSEFILGRRRGDSRSNADCHITDPTQPESGDGSIEGLSVNDNIAAVHEG